VPTIALFGKVFKHGRHYDFCGKMSLEMVVGMAIGGVIGLVVFVGIELFIERWWDA